MPLFAKYTNQSQISDLNSAIHHIKINCINYMIRTWYWEYKAKGKGKNDERVGDLRNEKVVLIIELNDKKYGNKENTSKNQQQCCKAWIYVRI